MTKQEITAYLRKKQLQDRIAADHDILTLSAEAAKELDDMEKSRDEDLTTDPSHDAPRT